MMENIVMNSLSCQDEKSGNDCSNPNPEFTRVRTFHESIIVEFDE